MTPKRLFYILLGVNVALVAASGAGYYYALGYIRSTSTSLSTQLADQASTQEELDDLSLLRAQYTRDIKPILPMIEEALPRTKNQTEILAQLQRVANASGLTLTGASFPSPVGLPTGTSQTVAGGAALALPVNFQISGSYTQLQTFLSQVENLSRFSNVTTLSVSRPDKTKPIVYTMTVNAYVKP